MRTIPAVLTLALALPGTAKAQVMVGGDATYRPDFVWRGLTRASRATVQPAGWIGVKTPALLLSAGAWANVEPAMPDPDDRTLVGTGSRDLGEVDLWAQADWRVPLATFIIDLSIGWVHYNYQGDPGRGGLGDESDTDELYIGAKVSELDGLLGMLGLPQDLPLAVSLETWIDVGPVSGFYSELGIEADLPVLFAGKPLGSVISRLALGWSGDQDRDEPWELVGYYDGDGPTHLDLSLGAVPQFSIGPVPIVLYTAGHLQLGFDAETRRRRQAPNDLTRIFPWFEVTASVLFPLRNSP